MFSILLLIMIPLGMCEPFLGIRFENPLQLKHCLANYGVKHGYQLWYMQNDMYKYLQEHALMMDEEALREEEEEQRKIQDFKRRRGSFKRDIQNQGSQVTDAPVVDPAVPVPDTLEDVQKTRKRKTKLLKYL